MLDQEDFLSGSDSSYSSSSEEEEDDDVPCTPEKKTKSSRIFSTPKSSRKPAVHTPAKALKKTVRFHIKELFLLFLSQLFECLLPVYQSYISEPLSFQWLIHLHVVNIVTILIRKL